MTEARDPTLTGAIDAILGSYRGDAHLSHVQGGLIPNRESVWGIVGALLRLLFPGYLETTELAPDDVVEQTVERANGVARRLAREIEKGMCLRGGAEDAGSDAPQRARDAARRLLERIPAIRDALALDVEAALEGDPAARSREEIIAAYPGLQAIAVYRLAHELHEAGVPLVPRMMTEYAHSLTGIDIHPGAKIGKAFFIDHGTGVVIGETATIGNHVKIYQGVTLGARSFPRDEEGRLKKGVKRHPDIADGVTIYSGATVLGDIRIGEGSVVGGNVWLTRSVPRDTKIIVTPPQQMHIDRDVNDYQI